MQRVTVAKLSDNNRSIKTTIAGGLVHQLPHQMGLVPNQSYGRLRSLFSAFFLLHFLFSNFGLPAAAFCMCIGL